MEEGGLTTHDNNFSVSSLVKVAQEQNTTGNSTSGTDDCPSKPLMSPEKSAKKASSMLGQLGKKIELRKLEHPTRGVAKI